MKSLRLFKRTGWRFFYRSFLLFLLHCTLLRSLALWIHFLLHLSYRIWKPTTGVWHYSIVRRVRDGYLEGQVPVTEVSGQTSFLSIKVHYVSKYDKGSRRWTNCRYWSSEIIPLVKYSRNNVCGLFHFWIASCKSFHHGIVLQSTAWSSYDIRLIRAIWDIMHWNAIFVIFRAQRVPFS